MCCLSLPAVDIHGDYLPTIFAHTVVQKFRLTLDSVSNAVYHKIKIFIEGKTMKCLKCGSENSAGANFCRGCGSGLNMSEPVAAVTTVPCLSCGQSNVPGKKFCSKCGASMTAQVPLPVEQPQQAIIKIASATPDGESKSCPMCGNSLKLAAKFCGKCGFNFEQKNSHPADESNKMSSASIEAVEAIQLQKNTVAITENVSPPPAAKVGVPQAKPPMEQAKPDVMQPVIRKPAASPQVPVSEKANKRPSGLIVVIVILSVCAMGAGAYWWFGVRQAVPTPVADAVNAQSTMVVVTPASAVVVTSEPIATPVAAKAAPPILAPLSIVSPVIPPVAKPVALPKPAAQPVQEKLHENGKVTKLLDDASKYITQGNYKQAEEAMKFCEMIDEGNKDCQRMKQKAVQLNDKMFDCVSAGKQWVDGRCN